MINNACMCALTQGVTGMCSALGNQNLIKLAAAVRACDARWVNANTAQRAICPSVANTGWWISGCHYMMRIQSESVIYKI